MESNLKNEEELATPRAYGWVIGALVASIGATLLLINICFTYFSFLRSGALLASVVDGRGGLWEINNVVPFLMVLAVIGGLPAAKFTTLKRLAIHSAIAAIFFGFICFTLVHFIRTSLR